MTPNYYVKTESFEGPFSLLLELIEKDKLDITRLSLSKVADDYLEHIERSQKVDLAGLSEFLWVASHLILIKSKALLPLFEFTREEEEEIDDLEARLKEYQLFKKAALVVNELLVKNQVAFSKSEEEVSLVVFTAPKIQADDLKQIFSTIVQEIPKIEELEQEVLAEVISLEDKINHLKSTIEQRMKTAFHDTIQDASDKIEVIVTFLALLEMIKQKVVSVQQENLFGQIMIEKSVVEG